MDEYDVLLEDIFPFLKENYRIVGAAGIVWKMLDMKLCLLFNNNNQYKTD